MPIRTNRGRAAVYRKLWGWPLRSPKHLAIAAFVMALVLTGAGIVVPKLAGKNGAPVAVGPGGVISTSPTTTTKTGPKPDSGPGGDNTPSTVPTRLTSTPVPTSAPPSPEALDTAEKWAKAWVNHPDGVTSEQWLDGLRPYTTEEYIAVMATVDPANVPAREITGAPRSRTSFEKSVDAEVPTDRGNLRITVIRTDQGWRVANYEQGE
ncbi:MAG: hypothetical protein M3548_09430 [Actinomycetota bacterium]|nr:hypothetical protein [Actinomycetota bacterium]